MNNNAVLVLEYEVETHVNKAGVHTQDRAVNLGSRTLESDAVWPDTDNKYVQGCDILSRFAIPLPP